jgi:creatinine amidohydrolase
MSPEDTPADFDRENDFLAMTRYEIEDHLAENGRVVIPTGSVEQHGRHLPVGTDAYAVREIARRVAARLDALLIPFGALGVTPFHAGMAGAIHLQSETFMALFRDVCESLIDHGAEEVVVVNWHEGNTSAIETAAGRLQQEHTDVRFVVSQASYAAQELYEDFHDLTHGGPLEVLPVLAADPDLVHLDRATDASDPEHANRMDRLRRNRRAYPVIPDVRIMYPSGWYGDLEGVDEEMAAEFVERVAETCAADVAEALDVLGDLDYDVGDPDGVTTADR